MTHLFPTRRSSDLIQHIDGQSRRGQFEGRARARARFEEQIDDGAAGEGRLLLVRAAQHPVMRFGYVEDIQQQFARQTLQRQQVAQATLRSEEHTSELQSLMRITHAVFRWKKNKT